MHCQLGVELFSKFWCNLVAKKSFTSGPTNNNQQAFLQLLEMSLMGSSFTEMINFIICRPM
jgi:hypothetical protein